MARAAALALAGCGAGHCADPVDELGAEKHVGVVEDEDALLERHQSHHNELRLP